MNQRDRDYCLKLFAVSKNTSIAGLKKKYRELIKIYHPDRHPERAEWSTWMMQNLNETYELLISRFPHNTAVSPVQPEAEKQNPGFDKPGEKTIGEIISVGDDSLRDAVVIGWLKRSPKDDFAQKTRQAVENSLFSLDSLVSENESSPGIAEKIIFFRELFSVFLKATAQKKPRPLPQVDNTTRFFIHFAKANKDLDSGIRDFYRFALNKRKTGLFNIPLSFLDDGIKLFAYLKAHIEDEELREVIDAKITLAELFKHRIRHPDLF